MPNYLLVFLREIRDQLRDRRTLFTIVVLPVLLYPLMGMTFMQVAQFKREHTSRIWLIGRRALPAQPPLVRDGEFVAELVSEQDRTRITLFTHDAAGPAEKEARAAIRQGTCDAAIIVPGNFATRLEEARTSAESEVPQPLLVGDTTNEHSQLALMRAERILNRWREQLVTKNLVAENVSPAVVQPFTLKGVDIASLQRKRTFGWSKILPFVAFLWALTGAFYPAIDMCAGEKERGTLETLLVSPASRLEIVMGKLLAVMSFSLGTCLLNLAGFAATGLFVLPHLNAGGVSLFAAPPWGTLGWLIVALVPVSALFSAIALALAAFARSSKEGQYYLMPVLFICLPLMTFALLPGMQLSTVTSLIPLTGIILWLRAVLEGRLHEVAWYVIPVSAVTLSACWVAIRWAVHQFHSESVLFAEVGQWKRGWSLRGWWNQRRSAPTVRHAIAVGIGLLVVRFYASSLVSAPADWAGFAALQTLTLVGTIALPALLAAIVLTRRPARALLLSRPRPWHLVIAGLLAVALHPLGMLLGDVVAQLIPMSTELAESLGGMQTLITEAPLWQILLVMAIAPAVCEELAFRGFLLSGFRQSGRTFLAVLASSLLFGLTHGIIQQSITAAIMGMVIGAVAVWTSSLWCCVVMHAIYNSLTFVLSLHAPSLGDLGPWTEWVWRAGSTGGFAYTWPYSVIMSGIALLLLTALYMTRCREDDMVDQSREAARRLVPTPHRSVVTVPSEAT